MGDLGQGVTMNERPPERHSRHALCGSGGRQEGFLLGKKSFDCLACCLPRSRKLFMLSILSVEHWIALLAILSESRHVLFSPAPLPWPIYYFKLYT